MLKILPNTPVTYTGTRELVAKLLGVRLEKDLHCTKNTLIVTACKHSLIHLA